MLTTILTDLFVLLPPLAWSQTLQSAHHSPNPIQYTTPVRPAASSKLLNSIRGHRLANDTPIKALPFSPSQFFNSPCNASGQNMATSTPVKRGQVRPRLRSCGAVHQPPRDVSDDCVLPSVMGTRDSSGTNALSPPSALLQVIIDSSGGGPLKTPPPNHALLAGSAKRSQAKSRHLLSSGGVTRTPTPFKRALAELRKQTVDPNGSGHLVEDITEIIDKENLKGARGVADSMYETDVSSNLTDVKESDKGTGRKVRKSLLTSAWEMSEVPYLAETPVSRGRQVVCS